jgi:hypothetical protein
MSVSLSRKSIILGRIATTGIQILPPKLAERKQLGNSSVIT